MRDAQRYRTIMLWGAFNVEGGLGALGCLKNKISSALFFLKTLKPLFF